METGSVSLEVGEGTARRGALTALEKQRCEDLADAVLQSRPGAEGAALLWLDASEVSLRLELADAVIARLAQGAPVGQLIVWPEPDDLLRALIPGLPWPDFLEPFDSESATPTLEPLALLAGAAGREVWLEAWVRALRESEAAGLRVLLVPDVSRAGALVHALLERVLAAGELQHLVCMLGGDADENFSAPVFGRLAVDETPESLLELAVSLKGGEGPDLSEFLSRVADGGRLRLVQAVALECRKLPLWPDEGVRELLRALHVAGGYASLGLLAELMDMPQAAWDALLARALAGQWLVPRGPWLTFWSDADAQRIARELPPGDRLRWQRRLAAVRTAHPARCAHAALASGAEAVVLPVLARAAHEALALGGLSAWARLVDPPWLLSVADDPVAQPLLLLLGMAALEVSDQQVAELVEQALLAAPATRGSGLWLTGRRASLVGDFSSAHARWLEALDVAPAWHDLLVLELVGLEEHPRTALATEGVRPLPDPSAWPGRYWTPFLTLRVEVWTLRRRFPGTREWSDADWLAAHQLWGKAAALGLWHLVADLASPVAAASVQFERFGCASEAHAVLADAGRAGATGCEPSGFDVVWAQLRAGFFESAQEHLPAIPVAERWVLRRALSQYLAHRLGLGPDPTPEIRAAWLDTQQSGDTLWGARLLQLWADVLLFYGQLPALFEAVPFEALDAQGPAAIMLRLQRAEAYWRDGAWLDVQTLLEAVWEEANWEHTPALAAYWQWLWASLHLDAGQLPEGAEALDAAQAWARVSGLEGLGVDIVLARGRLATLQGEPVIARDCYEQALNRAEMLPSPHHRALALAGLAEVSEDDVTRLTLEEQARAHFAVWYEPLGQAERAAFLRWSERLRVMLPGRHAGNAQSVDTRASLLGFLEAPPPGDEVYRWLQESMRDKLPLSRIHIYLCSEQGELRLADRWVDPLRQGAAGSDLPCPEIPPRVLREGFSLWVADRRSAPAWLAWEPLAEAGVEAFLAVPLTAPLGAGGAAVWGVVYAESEQAWSDVDEGLQEALREVAAAAGTVLRCRQAEEDSQRKATRLALLNNLNQALAGAMDVDGLLALALQQVLNVSEGEQGFVFFGDDLACRASLDHRGESADPAQVSRTVMTRVLQERKALTILDVGQDQEMLQKASLMLRNVRSVMCVPLLLDETVLGLLYVSSSSANKTFNRQDLDVLTAIAAQVALMLQNVRAFETIRELNQSLEAKVKERTEELEKALRELVDTQDQLLESEKLATVGTLAAGVAHEINNPLGAVLTNAQMLRLDLTDPEQLDSLSLIEDGARRCKEIVQALLTYSQRKEAGSHLVDLAEVVRDAIQLVSRQPAFQEVDLTSALDKVPPVVGDPGDLRQVVVQLLLNAAHAVREREPGLRCVRVSLERAWEGAVVAVADTGVGMSAEVQRRVFDPFFTTKAVGEGKGLGLSVCRRIIEQIGGSLSVVSEEGEGSTFKVSLPLP